MMMLRFVVKGLCRGPLARFPGLAERPERDPEQGQVLDEELPRFPREGGEAAGARLPDARRGGEEAQGREEHPDGRGAPGGGGPGGERAHGDEDRDGALDHTKHGREAIAILIAVRPFSPRASSRPTASARELSE